MSGHLFQRVALLTALAIATGCGLGSEEQRTLDLAVADKKGLAASSDSGQYSEELEPQQYQAKQYRSAFGSSSENPPFLVGGAIEPPTPIYKPQIELPDLKPEEIVGRVLIDEALISAQGVVRDVVVVRSVRSDYDQQVVETVKQYRFDPARQNSESVEVCYDLTVFPHPR